MVTKIILQSEFLIQYTNLSTQIIEDIGEGLHYCNNVTIIGYCTILTNLYISSCMMDIDLIHYNLQNVFDVWSSVKTNSQVFLS